MTDRFPRAVAAALCLAVCTATAAIAQPRRGQPDRSLTAAERNTVVDSVLARVREAYVFPERAAEMERAVRARQRRGEYDRITSSAALADSLTAHLRAVSHDGHLSVQYSYEPLSAGEPDAAQIARWDRERASYNAYQNAHIEKVERLAGNVGYLQLTGFANPEAALEPIRAAMAFLANTDALIIDLRENHGGRPETVALLASWLFGDQPVHVNTVVTRAGAESTEHWTKPEVPGAGRYGPQKPVYVLVSHGTFSAGEEFPYDLQALRRATIVGETTGGGAHPVGPRRATEHFAAMVPFARAVNPVTHTNWEGTGVHPDVAVAPAEALTAAHRLALQALLPKAVDDYRRDEIAGALAQLGDAPSAAAAGGR
ncbi:MAG TPA: S41 family peptidase [Longimicrobium sp.]|nr:S41 family peptidase [Longimicrobium sp.]